MNPAPEFSGLTRQTVAEIVGPVAAQLLIKIDHEHMDYGKNWRWTGGRQVFTAAGLELIAAELYALGHTGAATQLRSATSYAIQHEAESADGSAGQPHPRRHRDWLSQWQEEHGQ